MKLSRVILLLAAIACVPGHTFAADKRIVILAGKASHGPLQHEHRAGSLLLQKCLAGTPGIVTQVYDHDWPTVTRDGRTVDDDAAFQDTAAIIIYSDGGVRHPALQGERLALLGRLMQRGVGLGLLHYAVEPLPERGLVEFVDWVGGAFEIHRSVNPLWQADFTALPGHAVTRGVRPFGTKDEWYFNMRFRDGMHGITPVLASVPPARTMTRRDGPHEGNPGVRAAVALGTPQTVMWLAERPDGGRGFGFTGGHFHLGWKNDDQRKVVLNAILWIAQMEIPAGGVASTVTDEDLQANLDPKPAPDGL